MIDIIRTFLIEISLATNVYAAISATMIVWLMVLVYCHLAFCYNHRYRYIHWWTISSPERADAVLNASAALYFTYSLMQRMNAMYSFAVQEWTVSRTTSLVAPAYLPIGILALSGWMWWMAYNRHPTFYRRWWCAWMWIGMLTYGIVVKLF